jgi:hypothetical protein
MTVSPGSRWGLLQTLVACHEMFPVDTRLAPDKLTIGDGVRHQMPEFVYPTPADNPYLGGSP